MIQFMIVAVIVGAFTAVFFGAQASLKAGVDLLNLWMLGGLLIMIIGPFLGLVRLVREVCRSVAGIFRR